MWRRLATLAGILFLLARSFGQDVSLDSNELGRALYEALGHLKGDNLAHKTQLDIYSSIEGKKNVSGFWKSAKDGALISSDYYGKLRRRCSSYSGCQSHASSVEVFNGIFMDNILWLKDVDNETLMQMEALQDFYAGRKDFLPSALAKPGVWTPGPKIMTFKSGDKGAPTTCDKVWDTNAFFHFPWETANAYHSLNDNLMSILASVVLQYASDFLYKRERGNIPNGRDGHYDRNALFLFRNFDTSKPTIIYNALFPLFGGHVYGAKEVLGRAKGTQCFRRITWGSASKPFYKDNLFAVRRAMYIVFRSVLEKVPGVDKVLLGSRNSGDRNRNTKRSVNATSSTPANAYRSSSSSSSSPPPLYTLKVVVVSRGGSGAVQSGHRRYVQKESESRLIAAFSDRGHRVEGCCDFKRIRTIPDVMAKFGDVDVCMGIHGAGLANCIFGPPGMVIFEMQTRFHNFGFDSFMKVAHMAGGTHVFMDTGEIYTKKTGVVLSESTVKDIVEVVEKVTFGDEKLWQSARNIHMNSGQVLRKAAAGSGIAPELSATLPPPDRYRERATRVQSRPVRKDSTSSATATATATATGGEGGEGREGGRKLLQKRYIRNGDINKIKDKRKPQPQNTATATSSHSENSSNPALGEIVHSVWQYKRIFVLTPPLPSPWKGSKQQRQQQLTLLSLLGPEGKAKQRSSCEKLPYYAFRRYTEMQVLKFKNTCDDEKIMRKPSKKPAAALLLPHLM